VLQPDESTGQPLSSFTFKLLSYSPYSSPAVIDDILISAKSTSEVYLLVLTTHDPFLFVVQVLVLLSPVLSVTLSFTSALCTLLLFSSLTMNLMLPCHLLPFGTAAGSKKCTLSFGSVGRLLVGLLDGELLDGETGLSVHGTSA